MKKYYTEFRRRKTALGGGINKKIKKERRERKANWIGYILRRNCLLERIFEGKIEGWIDAGPYLHTGPGPRAANFQGRLIKKIEIEVWYVKKKGCPRERNLREIYTENNVGTEFSHYDAAGARRS